MTVVARTRRPGRVFAAGRLLGSLGLALYSTGSVVWLVRQVGLSPARVGVGVSVAGLAAVAGAVPTGLLCDRYGPREVTAGANAALAAALLALPRAHSFAAALAVLAGVGLLEQAAVVADTALLAGVVGAADRVPLLARLRSVFNAGFTLGALLAGLAIAANTPAAYRALFLGGTAAALAVAGLTLRLPRVAAAPAARAGAVADLPYLRLSLLCGLVTVHDVVLSVGVPLWIVTRTHAPAVALSWLLALNTVLVVTVQVPAARGAATVAGARRLLRRAAGTVAAACLLLGLAGGRPALPAVLLLAAGVVALTLGELWSAGASWQLRYAFARAGAQGRYAAAWSLGGSVRTVAGPALVAGLTGHLLLAGWVALAGLFAAAALLVDPTVTACEETR
jgi:hypothetical protein